MFGYVAVLLLMVLTISMLFTNGFGSNTRDRRITYPQLLTMIEEGQVRSVAIRGTSLVGVTTTTTVADADFPDKNYDFETIIGADFIVTARRDVLADYARADRRQRQGDELRQKTGAHP